MSESESLPIPAGLRVGAVRAGIKPSGGLDLAVFIADRECAAAGTFTTNRVAAAPVQWCRSLLPTDHIRAVVVNAGNANAATGEQGLANARKMAEVVAGKIGCDATQVLVASTGVIGRQLPMDKVEAGIIDAIRQSEPTEAAFHTASQAIMTTDTRPKVVSRTVKLSNGDETSIVGLAKGAAMIGPNMATMLGFLFTDAKIGPGQLHGILTQAVEDSFNCISVEGHMSTNDTVLLLALGNTLATVKGDDLAPFARAVREVCLELSRKIVDDGEGTTHTITIDVEGCTDRAEARKIAEAVAHSPLVKTAISGADPNWGRIVSAAGYAGIPFAEEELSLWVNGFPLYQNGMPLPFEEAVVSAAIRDQRETHFRLLFTRGDASIRFWTTDLTAEYVRLNADYTT